MKGFKLYSRVIFGIVFMFQIQCIHSYPSEEIENGEIFDFIVVGGGTAGCAVAARLAESGEHSVLLVEAGDVPDPNLDIRALSPAYARRSTANKVYPTVPHRNAGLANAGVINFRIGEMLGGSSGINGMVLNRGNPNDYNNWAKLTEDESWSYKNMLKYLKRFENYTGDHPSDQRGFKGPIQVGRPEFAPGANEWLQAGLELGYPIGEPNGPQTLSFTLMDSTITKNNGRRVSSFKGYIEPMLLHKIDDTHFNSEKRSNLLILIKTEVKRIIFDEMRAVGVKFISNSTAAGYARARKEVILTAGVIDSALLLQKSGVGPKSILYKANIPVVKHLPVGKNLHDHVSVTVAFVLKNSSVLIPERDFNSIAWRMLNELGDGPYTSFLGGAIQAFVQSSTVSPYEKHLRWPDLHLLPMNTATSGIVGGTVNVTDLLEGEAPIRWAAFLTRPRSRGTVTINPSNIDGPPLIDFQFFAHDDDLRAVLEGVNLLIKVCEETNAMQSIGCRLPRDSLPACRHLKFKSDAYWGCYARQLSTTGIHAGGSCRMGKGRDDLEAVVDSKLRVIGIEGLRVADASVMPSVTNANTQGAVYGIAEKAADLILNDWAEHDSDHLEGEHGWGRTA